MRAAVKEQLLILPFLAPALLGVIGEAISDAGFSSHAPSVQSEAYPVSRSTDVVRSNRRLTGRFLHITDIHPDPFYRTNASVSASCHHNKPEDDPERAPRLGRAVSECDSPLALVDHTFDWLHKNWANDVDFVVWTGDNARHDIDSSLPRSLPEIYKLNIDLSERMIKLFESRGIPVIPSLGNNDIYPHNIIEGGPNRITNQFAKIWDEFVPQEEFHTVARGVYFGREVIPGLIVVSLNTMYFFDNNKVVDGCPPTRPGDVPDPGTLQLDWLVVQLDRWREQGKQVWLTGHVPPTDANWWPLCLNRYKEITISFQDTILGQIFGHVNVDHFAFLDYATLDDGKKKPKKRSSSYDTSLHDRIGINKFAHQDLLSAYEGLPRQSKLKLDNYVIIHTVPSVIPTYLPGVRIWNYNVSNASDAYRPDLSAAIDVAQTASHTVLNHLAHTWIAAEAHIPLLSWLNDGFEAVRRKRRKHPKKKKKPIPRLPRHASADSPARRNRYLTPLGYTQYFLPIDRFEDPAWEIEYTTYAAGKAAEFLPPHMQPNSSQSAFASSYELQDLTIPSWLQLAKKFTKSTSMWSTYVHRMYVSSSAEKGKK